MADVFGFRTIRQYEQGIVFRWGQALPGVRKPGLIWINPVTSRLTGPPRVFRTGELLLIHAAACRLR
jgi:regulator of protease activity HflC (stomatin/prohibitin superfamily)